MAPCVRMRLYRMSAELCKSTPPDSCAMVVMTDVPLCRESIDINVSGPRMLVTQEGGRAYLISLNANHNRGTIEQTYTSEKFHNSPTPMFPGVFAMRGQTVLYGYMQDCVPIWNRKKGSIVYGLKHNKGK
jgi:hypothetical protein